MSRGTPDPAGVLRDAPTGLSPSPAGLPRSVPLPSALPWCSPKPRDARIPVWAPPLSLAATRGIDFSFFSSGYLDVSVRRVPSARLPEFLPSPRAAAGGFPAGFPHSDICGSLPICGSPQLFAACRVFVRPTAPWHPPCALLCLTSAFSRLAWRYFGFFMEFSASIFRASSRTAPPSRDFCFCLFCSRCFPISSFSDSDIFWFFGFQYSVFKVQYRNRQLYLFNGDGGVRTLDPLLARQVLSQLSYIPVCRFLRTAVLSCFLRIPCGLRLLSGPAPLLS